MRRHCRLRRPPDAPSGSCSPAGFRGTEAALHDQQSHAENSLTAALASILRLLPGPLPDRLDTTAADCLAIIKGINDAAGERGETDMAGLEKRVKRAVFGYLGLDISIAI
ncbi:hypothetical protein [Novosphingobium sp. ST904]|uniref:hypothetical protein n=1 Tax=Novosphingobium sp. ST904 TaxID=1684385 RepID=UPI0035163B7C